VGAPGTSLSNTMMVRSSFPACAISDEPDSAIHNAHKTDFGGMRFSSMDAIERGPVGT
jgi:hypothetical protein